MAKAWIAVTNQFRAHDEQKLVRDDDAAWLAVGALIASKLTAPDVSWKSS
jgi:hypothetical protein